MSPYKHYSFDLWLTLIRSNPQFKQQRARIFHQRFNKFGKPLEEVEHIFRQVDLMVNGVNEATGKNIDAEEMYLMVITIINDTKLDLQDIDIHALYRQMEDLVLEYMPLIYCDRTEEVLAYLHGHPEYSANLLSNTGFIKGITLRKVLHNLGIGRYFDYQLYSDVVGMSKPNPAFFQLMVEQAMALRPISLNEIIHIGDNPRADIRGAEMVGIGSMLVNSNNTSIIKLLPDVTQNVFAT